MPPHLVNAEWMCGFWSDSVYNGTASHRAQNLSYHVENGSEEAHVAAGQKAHGDGRIQMGTADVTYTLGYRGNGQAKGKCHFDLMVRVGIILVSYCSRQADEDENDHSQAFGQHCPPKFPCFHFWHECTHIH